MIKIKRVGEKEAPILAEMDKEAYREMKVWTLQTQKDFAKSLRRENFYSLIAYSGKEAVGYIETEFDAGKEIVWIKNIFVMEEYRKRKIARELIMENSDDFIMQNQNSPDREFYTKYDTINRIPCKQITRYWKKKTRLLVLLTADRNLKIFQKLGFNKTMNYLVQEI